MVLLLPFPAFFTAWFESLLGLAAGVGRSPNSGPLFGTSFATGFGRCAGLRPVVQSPLRGTGRLDDFVQRAGLDDWTNSRLRPCLLVLFMVLTTGLWSDLLPFAVDAGFLDFFTLFQRL